MLPPIVLLTGYLLGSVNVAILLVRWLDMADPRTQYSGNPGVSNVYRQSGPLWAGLVLLAEVAKSSLLGWVALKALATQWIPWAGLALLMGNRWPCFHQFRGGKGVANFLGFCLPLISTTILATGLGAYLVVLKWRRTPFIASFALLGFLCFGMALKLGSSSQGLTGIVLCAILVLSSHYRNIRAHFG
jgi:glycerol-3-phosphate acyltransferase PlsY